MEIFIIGVGRGIKEFLKQELLVCFGTVENIWKLYVTEGISYETIQIVQIRNDGGWAHAEMVETKTRRWRQNGQD